MTPSQLAGCALLLLTLSAAAAAAPPDLEQRARKLETRLIAPCCWRQPVADHLSEDSDRMKREIRVLLGQGRTDDEILAHYVQEYGQAILSQPPYQGFYLLAYLLPPAFLAGLGWALYRYLARSRQVAVPAAPAVAPPENSPAYAAQLAQALRDLDP